MVYHGQKVVRLPVASDATGELIHVDVWAVNFRDPAKKGRPDENSGDVPVFVETCDGLTSENLGLLALAFNGSRRNFIA